MLYDCTAHSTCYQWEQRAALRTPRFSTRVFSHAVRKPDWQLAKRVRLCVARYAAAGSICLPPLALGAQPAIATAFRIVPHRECAEPRLDGCWMEHVSPAVITGSISTQPTQPVRALHLCAAPRHPCTHTATAHPSFPRAARNSHTDPNATVEQPSLFPERPCPSPWPYAARNGRVQGP
jgi:hypothetical protein